MSLPDAGLEISDERKRQVARDEYYMGIAAAVQSGAKCTGTLVGAVITIENRVISTGYNGTPQGLTNCAEGGCVRCRDSSLNKLGLDEQMTDPAHVSGSALDRCVCVHAEQNALLTAARFGIAVDGGCMYTTSSPCFGCLKEAVQAGISRIVYRDLYVAKYSDALTRQYESLCDLLRTVGSDYDPSRFEALGGIAGEEVDLADLYASDGADPFIPPTGG